MGPPWADEWEGHVFTYDRRHNTCIFNKVLLRGEVKLTCQQMVQKYLQLSVGGAMVGRVVRRESGSVGACS